MMIGKWQKTFMMPVMLLVAVMIVASCTTIDDNDTNGNGLEAPFFDSGQDMDMYYENGIFHYSFMVDLPSPCYTVEKNEIIMESYPERVMVDVAIKSTDDDMCAQVITPYEVTGSIPLANLPASFSVSLKGDVALEKEMGMEVKDDHRISSINMNRMEGSLEYGFTLNLPNPCYSYALDESIQGLTLTIDITMIPPKDDVMCIQVIEQKRVEGSIEGNIDEVKIFIDSELVYYEHLV